MLHTDGAPVTKIGRKSLWPVRCTLVEIPPPIRDHMDATMVLSAWLGSAQFVTFDLPAFAQNCNIVQYNSYYACPDCDIRDVIIDRSVYYPYSKLLSIPRTDRDYIILSKHQPTSTSLKGIKGPSPLQRILVFPDQIVKGYMHLICGGHLKTLITYWERILLCGVFDQSSNYLISISSTYTIFSMENKNVQVRIVY